MREGKAKARTLSDALATVYNIEIKSIDPGVAWLVMWACMTINIGRRGKDGRTAWELRHGKPFKRPVANFGELITCLPEPHQAS